MALLYTQWYKLKPLLKNLIVKTLFIICSLLVSSIAFSQNSYKAIDGEEYFIGDTLTLGYGEPSASNKYAHIKYNLAENDTTQFFRSMPKIPNTQAVIKRIYTNQFGEVCFETISSRNYYYRIPVDRAINGGELKSKDKSFRTSNEAMYELTEAKKKLDLGLLTQSEYDSLLSELKKYIH